MRRVLFSLCLLPFAATPLFAAESGKALLIGVEGYEKVPALKFVGNDVRRLAESFSDRCGFEVVQVIDTAVDESVEQIGPTTHRDALMKIIEDWIAGMDDTDTAVLYFSGHGFLDAEGKLYLAALNCDAKDPVPGGVPVAWLREQLSKCPARRKILLLDACHAGASKSVDLGKATAKAFAVEMRKLTDVETLASCSTDEESVLWPGKRQSLFTYWLSEAAKGHADADADGRVTMDELAEYVGRNVARTAEVLEHRQTPTRLGGDASAGSLELAPKPVSLKRLIMDMAEKIDTRMRQKKLAALAVPEFASGESGGTLGDAYGTLPAYIANELTDRLVLLADGDYQVIGGTPLHEELARREIDAATLETKTPEDLKVDDVPIDLLAIGRVRGREGATFRLGCKLKKPGLPGQTGSANGVCFLNESEWSMLGHSGAAPPPSPVGNTESPQAAMAARIDTLDAQAKKPHPAVDPNFPFAVEIFVKNDRGEFVKREGGVRGNDYIVPLKTGEIYAIKVLYREKHEAFLRVLVDGLNTLPQRRKRPEKGMDVEGTGAPPSDEKPEWVVAPRVNLAEARPWHLEPAGDNPAPYAFRGFYKEGENGTKDTYNEFVVTNAPDSTAARRGYTENIGLITVALYTATKPRAIGTKRGKEYQQDLETYEGGLVPGELLGVLHIRYEEP